MIQSSDDLLQLFLTCDSIGRGGRHSLVIPYFPYSRQDRRCYEGEASSADLMVNIISKLDFRKFKTVDIHNPSTLFYLSCNEIVNELPIEWNGVLEALQAEKFTAVVSPDKGAISRARSYGEALGLKTIRADKKRNPENGRITGFAVNDFVSKGERLLIVDDICDGGGTFVGLSAELKRLGADRVSLFVAHGIFSKGIEDIKPEVDEVFYTNSRGQDPELPYTHLFRA